MLINYVRSILEDLGYLQDQPTLLYEDNMGALLMANDGDLSKRTRHIDIKHFALLDWVEQDHMILARVETQNNAADSMSKANARIKFHSHMDVLLGKRHLDVV